MAELSNPPYQVVLQPSRGWLRVDWRELWEYRDLLLILVHRDFIARYKQTLLGPLWYVLQPLLTTALFVVMFSRGAKISTDGTPAPLFYLAGLIGWTYFAQNITAAGSTFITNAHMFGKVWFPRLVLPISTIVSNLFALLLQFIPFLLLLGYYALQSGTWHFNWLVLLMPLAILHIALLSLGVSLWMAATTAKYRDLVHLNQFIVQLWMLATVVYPLSAVPAKFAWIVWLNPMSVPVEVFRLCLLGRGTLEPGAVAMSLGVTLVLLFTGIGTFQKTARTAADSI
jgi:lipopolysaccharide transport system permease protein